MNLSFLIGKVVKKNFNGEESMKVDSTGKWRHFDIFSRFCFN